ncbi:hypothetical protein BU15DRAFT_49442 [Melanogaster broomeanus]|nr:hypothetical protein BU15DRAFT_49442 [Melanogaster broomeanus]
MSELDADLYGDLYGNDESDFTATVEPNEVKTEDHKTTEAQAEISAPSATKPPEPRQEPKQEPKATAPAPQPIKSESSIAPSLFQDYGVTQTQSGSFQDAPQQIPTYQQPSDYSTDMSRPGAFDRSNMPERSIRPSEMKDEG